MMIISSDPTNSFQRMTVWVSKVPSGPQPLNEHAYVATLWHLLSWGRSPLINTARWTGAM